MTIHSPPPPRVSQTEVMSLLLRFQTARLLRSKANLNNTPMHHLKYIVIPISHISCGGLAGCALKASASAISRGVSLNRCRLIRTARAAFCRCGLSESCAQPTANRAIHEQKTASEIQKSIGVQPRAGSLAQSLKSGSAIPALDAQDHLDAELLKDLQQEYKAPGRKRPGELRGDPRIDIEQAAYNLELGRPSAREQAIPGDSPRLRAVPSPCRSSASTNLAVRPSRRSCQGSFAQADPIAEANAPPRRDEHGDRKTWAPAAPTLELSF